MSNLTHRQSTLLPDDGSGNPSWGASYLVTALPVGATANGASSASPVTVRAGHGLRVDDKFIVGTDTAKYRTVSAVNANGVEISYSGAAISIASEDKLVNLGPDTGVPLPNYDGSPIQIWDEASDAGTAETNSTVTADTVGMYQYWCKGENWWELIRSDATTPASVVAGVGGSAGRYNVVDFGAAIDGTTDDEAAAQAAVDAAGACGGGVVYFPGGSCLLSSLSVTEDNVELLGAGDGVTKLLCTGASGTISVDLSGVAAGNDTSFIMRDLRVEQNTNALTSDSVMVDVAFSNGGFLSNVEFASSNNDADLGSNGVALALTDVNNFDLYNIAIRGYNAYMWGTGVDIANGVTLNRGNVNFHGGLFQRATTGLSIAKTATNLVNNVQLLGTKFHTGTIGVDTYLQARNISLYGVHIEAYETSVKCTSSKNVLLQGCTFSQFTSGAEVGIDLNASSRNITVLNSHFTNNTVTGTAISAESTVSGIFICNNDYVNMTLDTDIDSSCVGVTEFYRLGTYARFYQGVKLGRGVDETISLIFDGSTGDCGLAYDPTDAATSQDRLTASKNLASSANLIAAGNLTLETNNDARLQITKTVEELTGMSGATVTTGTMFPAGCLALGVTCRVTTAITGATDFDIGDGTDVDAFGAGIAIALDTTTDGEDFTIASPAYYTTAKSIVLTANGGTFSAGAVRVVAWYIDFVAPTS